VRISYFSKSKSQDDLFLLYKALGWADMLNLEKEQLNMAMENSCHAVYAYDGDKLVGTSRILTDGALHTYLCGLGVIKEYRNRGIGAEITKCLTEYCELNGLKAQLNCEEKMVPYYEKLGFEKFSIGMKKLL